MIVIQKNIVQVIFSLYFKAYVPHIQKTGHKGPYVWPAAVQESVSCMFGASRSQPPSNVSINYYKYVVFHKKAIF